MIHTEKLTKYYGKHRGIIDIDLDVNEGEIFGFIGPNGAGKSTMIRCLLDFITPTSGTASVAGLDSKAEPSAVHGLVGYMPGEAIFYNEVKVKEIIKLSADLRKMDCSEEAARLVKRFDIDVTKRIEELSLGNRKKVSIVCAFQHKPKVYFLDEPTSGLDPLMKNEFFKLLIERQKEGATIFLSTHVLSEVQQYCERAAFIKEGRIIQVDTIENYSKVQAKKVHVHSNQEIALTDDMENVKKQNGSTTFLYKGSPQALISHLANYEITDLTITEPDLEEIFMHFYGESNHD